jgi:hypothetical protein
MNSYLLACRYYFTNISSARHLTDPSSGFDLAVTSHADRVRRVFMAIESACSGLRPVRVILYLAKDDWHGQLPRSLARLKDRGLEIHRCENLGPHKKQQAYLAQGKSFDRPLVTIDDDVFYGENLLERLYSAWQAHPQEIHCSRARIMQIRLKELAPYKQWPPCTSSTGSLLAFPTGVGGVLYPPDFLLKLKFAGRAFLKRPGFRGGSNTGEWSDEEVPEVFARGS